MTQRSSIHGISKGWRVLFVLGILLVLALIVLTPWNISGLVSHPRPVQGYNEALQRIQTLQAQEPPEMNPVCKLQLMTHEEKVERAIILVHGYSSCPQQFHELGRRFYDLGYNVLIAPLPHHGLADRMTVAHSQLTAEEMVTYADETADIAQGLGEQVIMLGFSAGGTIASWTAQNRSDVDVAIIVAPGFGFKLIPTPLTAAAMNIFTFLPDSFTWFDPVLQANVLPFHTYPRYSRHALAQIVRLGFATQAAARRAPPVASKMVVVVNGNDDAVNNGLTMDVVKLWQAHHAHLTTYAFDVGLKLNHDLIDPEHPDQQIEIVYPRLIELTVDNFASTPE